MNRTARILISVVLFGIIIFVSVQASKLDQQSPVAAAENSTGTETDTTTVSSTIEPKNTQSEENPSSSGQNQEEEKPSGSPALSELAGEDLSGAGFTPPHIEAEGMQLLQHYGALTGTVRAKGPLTCAHINLKPRPVNGSNPVVSVFMERTEGGRYLRIPIITDFEVKDAAGIKKDVDIPTGTYKLTLGFYKSTKEDRSQLEVHGIRFDAPEDSK